MKGGKDQQQGKGINTQQDSGKKKDKQKQHHQPQQQQKWELQSSGKKTGKPLTSKDEKAAATGSEGSEMPQKTKAELKAKENLTGKNYDPWPVILS